MAKTVKKSVMLHRLSVIRQAFPSVIEKEYEDSFFDIRVNFPKFYFVSDIGKQTDFLAHFNTNHGFDFRKFSPYVSVNKYHGQKATLYAEDFDEFISILKKLCYSEYTLVLSKKHPAQSGEVVASDREELVKTVKELGLPSKIVLDKAFEKNMVVIARSIFNHARKKPKPFTINIEGCASEQREEIHKMFVALCREIY